MELNEGVKRSVRLSAKVAHDHSFMVQSYFEPVSIDV